MDQSLAAAFDVDVIGGLSRLAGVGGGSATGTTGNVFLSLAPVPVSFFLRFLKPHLSLRRRERARAANPLHSL